eukprot:XP_011660667.1 PREDICTED: uncharacterized protein LOC105436621 isoform X1 [Strongylocentrotus purpuratus]
MEWCNEISPCLSVVLVLFLQSSFMIGTVKIMGVLLHDMSKSLHTTSIDLGVMVGVFMASCFLLGRATLGPLAVKSRVSPANLAMVVGVMDVFGGCGAIIGGYMAGWISDLFSSYDATYKFLVAVDVFTFISMAIPKAMKKPDVS